MKRKYIKAIPAFLIICMLLIYSIILGNVEISFTAKGCKIETSILSDSFEYHEISSIKLVNDIRFMKDGFVFPFVNVYCGKFKDPQRGSFKAYAYKESTCFILIRLMNGEKIVINQPDTDITLDIYHSLCYTFNELNIDNNIESGK